MIKPVLWGVVILLLGICMMIWIPRPMNESPKKSDLSLRDLLTLKDAQGFEQVLKPRTFSFPEDHGPHPMFRNEWWYYTGNLETHSGRAFGFQFTLFRSALSPEKRGRPSSWAANQVYMGHFTITDVEAKKFYPFERFARGAMGLAGVEADPFRLWIESWRMENGRLQAQEDQVGVDLYLKSQKPVVLLGDSGLSRKGEDPANASYYYSQTRIQAEGLIRVEDQSYRVKGLAWMDREWSTSTLEEDQAGWDWFSMHLDNGCDLMFYQMRKEDGAQDPFSKGCWVDPSGAASPLASDQVKLEVLDVWKNYPSKWRLFIPEKNVTLLIQPLVADQELKFQIQYWEGAVSITGTIDENPVTGKGYVELTGYAD